jgi:hypothetical protein
MEFADDQRLAGGDRCEREIDVETNMFSFASRSSGV